MKLYSFNQWLKINESSTNFTSNIRSGKLLEGVICEPEDLAKMEIVKKRISTIFPKAIEFWKSWLEDPITKNKIKNDNKFNDAKLQEVYSKYFNLFEQIKIVYVGFCFAFEDGKMYAFVNERNPTTVHCSPWRLEHLSDEFIEETLIHEIQHLLYFIQPMSPELKLQNCFNINNKPKGLLKNFIKNLFRKKSKEPLNLDTISKNFEISREEATSLYEKLSAEMNIQLLKDGADYLINPNENYSRVMELRKKFGIKPGQDITPLNFKTDIKNIVDSTDLNKTFNQLNSSSSGTYWLLLHWAYTGFPDFKILLNNLNQLAYGKTQDAGVKTV